MRQSSSVILFLAMCLASGLISSGCSSTPAPPTTEALNELSGTDEQIFVGDSIEMNYDPNVIMKRAEAYFEKESYLEAIVEYKHFLDLHRNHMLAPYSQYKIAMSHYKRFQTIDRDPQPIKESLDAFQVLLTNFPKSRYESEAHEKITSCQEYLAQHDLFVGQFYYKRQSYLAAAHRFKNIIDQFPHLEASGEAMYHLAETYEKLGDEQWASDWLVTLVQKHKDHPYYQPGMQMLASLQASHPDLTVPEITEPEANDIQLAKVEPLAPLPISQNNSSSFATPTRPGNLAECSLGSWCGPSSPSPSPQASPSSALDSCRPGQWC